MYVPFTKRDQAPPQILDEAIPDVVRNRIWAFFQELAQGYNDVLVDIVVFAARRSKSEHGTLSRRRQYQTDPCDPKYEIQNHYFGCDPDEFLEFLEMMLQSPALGPAVQTAVDVFNKILREEGCAYRFTDLVVKSTPGSRTGSIRHDITPSIAVRITEEATYQQTIQPALRVLGNSLFKAANDELLAAHKHFRDGKWDDAITNAGKSLESVLKVICGQKKWKYNPDADVLSRLVDTCNQNGLFPPFYVEVLKNAGTIRNKLGAHGKANTSHGQADELSADHLIQLVSAHVLFLIKLANL